jgi:hypothetical protein
MSVIGSNILAGAAGQGGGYVIDNSLRLRSSASAYLSRTPASAGNRKTWTWSGWVKRGAISAGRLFGAGNSTGVNNNQILNFNSSDSLAFSNDSVGTCSTSSVYRDPSAWYHVVLAVDTTQATTADRAKLYVNGEFVAWSNTVPLSLNLDTKINSTESHTIGRSSSSASGYIDGYLTEVNFIDGQALTPSAFGDYNEDTGVWQPAKYAGSYGTNGFYLNFSDATTTTTLAADSSGNGNNWTPNNISLTAGFTYDSMTDTPTPYADGGNYAVWNPLVIIGNSSFSNGNLTATNGTTGASTCTIPVYSGKYYAEFQPLVVGNTGARLIAIHAYSAGDSITDFIAKCVAYQPNGTKRINSSNSSYGAAYTTADLIGVALDLDNNTIEFFKNNTSQGVIDTTLSQSAGTLWTFGSSQGGSISSSVAANFGQRPFTYTPPTGFKSLHTGNLPDSAIENGSEYFDTVTYTGNGTSGRSVTGLEFQPDWTWIKQRSGANNHSLYDVVRGAQNLLISNTTDPNQTDLTGLLSFDSDGFSVGTATRVNANASTYVAWNWKAGGAAVTNTAGSITSQVSASPTAGFSIVSYTGTGANATVGHGLGVAPAMMIVKNRIDTTGWLVYHHKNTSSPETDYLQLNSTVATADLNTVWNDTAPTSSVINLGSNSWGNGSGDTHVAYCFSEVSGYSKFGSYTGNGSADGVFVYLGFRPAFVIWKRTDSAVNWQVFDSARSTDNAMEEYLIPSLSNAEAAYPFVDFLSNGFKHRHTSGFSNASGGTYIYMAFAENPFKNSLAR